MYLVENPRRHIFACCGSNKVQLHYNLGSVHCCQRLSTLLSEAQYTVVRGSVHCCQRLSILLSEAQYTVVRGSVYCCQRLSTLLSEAQYTVVRGSVHCCQRLIILLSGAQYTVVRILISMLIIKVSCILKLYQKLKKTEKKKHTHNIDQLCHYSN